MMIAVSLLDSTPNLSKYFPVKKTHTKTRNINDMRLSVENMTIFIYIFPSIDYNLFLVVRCITLHRYLYFVQNTLNDKKFFGP